ncbi:3-methyladenine DNA glycosylase [Floricoccus penangensis]|uniref:3-methyladenine DNA glycosylase n=1 Tax=Floricoccus penangensis TaxID=1859475 RepID=A0A9Q5JH39_9LACT|nr:DNA-3-methyladenine glycosylase I [Floricoccus penangensis]OFI47038.1 3-methyladenine DNA glycosylase [Floricoccus penangensis]
MKKRCAWTGKTENMIEYHDKVWGVPVHDDQALFAKLSLDLMQAGLSWMTILNKTENFYAAFDDFDYKKIAKYDDLKRQELLSDAGIVRNRLKVDAIINNANRISEIQEEFSSFDSYLWGFVDNKPIIRYPHVDGFLANNELSDRISKDLKKRGFKFVGTTIIYAFLQAVGIIEDHEETCFRKEELNNNKND